MIPPPPIADLTSISIAGAALERALQRWTSQIAGDYVPNVPTLREAVDFYTRLLAARKTIIKLFRLIPSREPCPDALPFNDLAALSAVGSMLERAVMFWAQEIEEVPDPDVPTLAEAIDIYTRLASARKTLIKLSRPTTPRPNRPNKTSQKSNTSDPVLSIDIPQLPAIPDLPYENLRPELDFISAALDHICPEILSGPSAADAQAPRAPEDPNASHDSHTSHISHSSHSSPSSQFSPPDEPRIPLDPRCVALNIHPRVDTTNFPDNHPWFDRSTLGHFNPKYLSPWNRKRFRRYG